MAYDCAGGGGSSGPDASVISRVPVAVCSRAKNPVPSRRALLLLMVFGWSKTADIAVFKPNVSTPAASDTNLNGNAAGKRKVAALDGAFVQSSTLWGRAVL